ncbi:PTS system beta-glucoside-specific IIA component, Glc family /PTS system beta-glucoside-specific IIB component, Glc family /PTS system beta-glucoside-specific IIC component, Glc family [Lacrimispora sphenoides]|jgi:PTS system beta-glucosides-specific IIC component|uniref:beta-glucoside-specific PTS transporter subunit IIABC n=1 Tax=Lacrimispora sphenoides TaxID=29370 RepID=UPI0008C409C3|nr:beta-glucoside-specific PTS transporter subunit IIABC [Lacrimispora sphenoides]SEU23462.1 PTS system beta-glucoside-specific IIA component, Glc family /PTS system beta-glucoside-specific IIB component, Glc family /PTS system beta-glucoside-specific IIC component, Glc family [Lacrimispora sphenoides]
MEHLKLAQEIILYCGGKDNITQAWNCITRLRFHLKDREKADVKAIQALNGVLGAQFQGDQFQVIIGNEVLKVFEGVKKELGDLIVTSEEKTKKDKKRENPINVLFGVISGIFNPILPAITGAGIIKGILALLIFLKVLNPESNNYFVLDMISNATYYFLPFLVAFSAGKKFGVNEHLSATLAGIIMYPAFVNLSGQGISTVKFLFLNIPVMDYNSTVIPIILGVLLLSIVYKFIDRFIPSFLKLIVTPVASLLITAPVVLVFIAPLGSYVGKYVAAFFIALFGVAGPVAGLLMGGLMSVIVITGMHYAFFPSTFDGLGGVGYDILLLPMSIVSNMGQCGAVLGAAFKIKDKKMKSIAFSSALSALFGITEPAIYGVNLKYKKPFYAALTGGAVGGAIYGIFHVKAYAFSIPGITALPTYLKEGELNNFIWACIGVAASFLTAFIITLLLPMEGKEKVEGKEKEVDKISQDYEGQMVKIPVAAPMTGKAVGLDQVPDKMFAECILGKGIAIIPDEGIVKAPFQGQVKMIAPTKHAIGLISDRGVNVVIHIGIDTVNLQGKGFEVLVKEDQWVEKGEPLMKVDLDFIRENHLNPITPIIVTNSDEYVNVLDIPMDMAQAGTSEVLIAFQ